MNLSGVAQNFCMILSFTIMSVVSGKKTLLQGGSGSKMSIKNPLFGRVSELVRVTSSMAVMIAVMTCVTALAIVDTDTCKQQQCGV